MSFRRSFNNLIKGSGFQIVHSTAAVTERSKMLDFDFDFLVRNEIMLKGKDFTFLQIGANDGDSRDDDLMKYVKEYGIKGWLVELQPDVFAKLQSKCSAYSDVVAFNKAIHHEKSDMTLYRFNSEILAEHANMPHWAKSNGIASFCRKHVVDHAKKLKLDESVIEEISVECISLDNLLKEFGRTPDLLKVDVEGYDYELLKAWDLEEFRPRIIRFENLHMKPAHYQEIIEKFASANYQFLANRMDTTAFRK
jgi:FkbM family methyltransferase